MPDPGSRSAFAHYNPLVPLKADFLIEHADLIATCAGPAPRRGLAQREISPLRDGVIAAFEGRITYAGETQLLTNTVDVQKNATRIDARGCTVIPGFVDAHTHVVHAGDRRSELQRRLAGATYAAVAAEGGGIAGTVAATRAASEDQLVAESRLRLDEMLACGTTTCEVKSGYGLTVESELRQLHAIRILDEAHPVDLVPTFMGAHDIPAEYRSRRSQYVEMVIDEMLPRVADEGLAEFCDVFCEACAFSAEESIAILEAGRRAGLMTRVHADELAASGGSSVAARVQARSADHLIFVDARSADGLADAGVCATLLPAAAFYLKIGRFAPARMLIERGVAVALGTDINPGAGLSPSMPFAVALASFAMSMTLEESLIAATLNAAWSVNRAAQAGSLEPGKLMDAVIVNGDLSELVRVGAPSIRTVIKRGRIMS
jgi:imidazolonepropionase